MTIKYQDIQKILNENHLYLKLKGTSYLSINTSNTLYMELEEHCTHLAFEFTFWKYLDLKLKNFPIMFKTSNNPTFKVACQILC